MEQEVIVGLDIGTTKVCVVIGTLNAFGEIEIIGVGTSPSNGLNKGAVINIEQTTRSIIKAVEDAEMMSGVEVESVFTGIVSDHIRGINSHGVIAVSKDRIITEKDVERVIDAAKALSIPLDREVIHVIPQAFRIDDQVGIKDPVGMPGVRLEADVHIITAAVSSAQNIITSIRRGGFDVNDIVLDPLASAKAVLTQDEKELGVILVDIGGGTSDILVYQNSSIVYTSVIAIGGMHVTKDISMGLRMPIAAAEEIKKKYGCAMSSLIDPTEQIEIKTVGGREPRREARVVLAEIIEARMFEIFQLIKHEMDEIVNKGMIGSGIVLTGGASALYGADQFAEALFKMPVRIGYPIGVTGLSDYVDSPMYATGVGLVKYGSVAGKYKSFKQVNESSLFRVVLRRMGEWFKEFL